eukprot:COSAG03_NODE_579_length_6871_cov_10.242764_2_plen_53_part_00
MAMASLALLTAYFLRLKSLLSLRSPPQSSDFETSCSERVESILLSPAIPPAI